MGIRLDWEIETEQAQLHQAGEDPATARQRRAARLRLVLFVLLVVALLGGLVGAVALRLQAVDAEIEQLLRNTVDAEVTALRLGDWTAFSAAQRSASEDWLLTQERVFNDYQQLKLQSEVRLTGRILDLTIDENRARVAIEEIIDGVPYSRVWFYWRYDDGWRHVPPDYTLWGDVRRIEKAGVSVRYQTVDAALAQSMADVLERWLQIGCGALVCGQLPPLMVEIVPDEGLQASWSSGSAWTLQIPSPSLWRARTDMPFDVGLQFGVANLLAERLVGVASGAVQPVYPADVYYLRQAVVSWLVGRFVQVDTNAFVISSLAANYGDAAVGRLAQAMLPNSDARILAQVIGAPSLDQVNLDWRDLLTWRLVTEDELIRRRDEVNFLALYDTRDPLVRDLAYQRFAAPAPEIQKVVVSARQETAPDGSPALRALVQVGAAGAQTQAETVFYLVDGLWRRAN